MLTPPLILMLTLPLILMLTLPLILMLTLMYLMEGAQAKMQRKMSFRLGYIHRLAPEIIADVRSTCAVGFGTCGY